MAYEKLLVNTGIQWEAKDVDACEDVKPDQEVKAWRTPSTLWIPLLKVKNHWLSTFTITNTVE